MCGFIENTANALSTWQRLMLARWLRVRGSCVVTCGVDADTEGGGGASWLNYIHVKCPNSKVDLKAIAQV